MGFYLNSNGKSRIARENEEVIHHVWSYLAYIAETIIFLLAGLIIGVRVLESKYIGGYDVLKVFALYALLHIVRFSMILLFWPLLRKMGYGLTIKFFYCPLYLEIYLPFTE